MTLTIILTALATILYRFVFARHGTPIEVRDARQLHYHRNEPTRYGDTVIIKIRSNRELVGG